MANVFRGQKDKLFKQVEVTTLTNGKATASNIVAAMNQLRTKTNPYSYVIVYLAGHGENGDNGDFFFDAYDFNPSQKQQTAVSWRQIQQALSNMPGKAIVILDSCRSGAVGNGNEIIVLSSALAHQNAGESNQNGYFTQALIEGLSGRADLNGNGIVTLAEINLYVSERVEQLSAGKQQAATVIPPNTPSGLPLTHVSLPGTIAAKPMQPVTAYYPPDAPPPMTKTSPVMHPQSSLFDSSGPLDRPPRN
jgi:uncharacterized caspase-like protein